jgi:hypothetical protein
MWVLVPTDEILFFVRMRNMDVVNAENSGAIFRQKKYPKEIRPMPLASCAYRIYQGLPKGTPVPLAMSGIPAAPLRAIPDKCSDARRGIRERVLATFPR